MRYYTKLFNGIYRLDKRVKQINKNYRLVFNNKLGRFELYVKQGLNFQKELNLGTRVDAGVIDKIWRTRKENFAVLLQNIERFNEKIEQNAFFESLDKAKQIAKECILYADKKSCDLQEKDILKIIN